MNSLLGIPGVGETLGRKLADGLGGEAGALKAIQERDIASISSIEGISVDRAIKIVSVFSGEGESAAKNQYAQHLHNSTLQDIATHISSSAARKKLGILQPLSVNSQEDILDRRRRVEEAISFVASYPSATRDWARITKSVKPLSRSKKKVDRLIVVQNPEELENLGSAEDFARIVVRGSGETWKDYEGLPRVTWIGSNQPTELPPGWRICDVDDNLWELIPELALRFVDENVNTINALIEISNLDIGRGVFSEKIRDALDGLEALGTVLIQGNEVDKLEEIKDGLWNETSRIQDSVDDMIVAATQGSKLSLDGTEMLSYYSDSSGLQNRLKYEVSESIEYALEEGKDKLREYLDSVDIKIPSDCFQSDYPCLFNKETITRIEEGIDFLISKGEDESIKKRVLLILSHSERISKAVSEVIDLDLWIGIARWCEYRRCTLPVLATSSRPSCKVKGLRHPLLGVDPVPIDYGFGSIPGDSFDGSIVLLTGANSGGKTSLIEGIGIVVLLAHAGLPVPCDEAVISLAEEIHIMSKVTGTQSAGALERTLIKLATIVGSSSSKFVLADELEAITEPEAASAILAGLLDVAAKDAVNSILMVTHIGSSICGKMDSDARVDGIEAKGLDEELELVVDRVPRIGIPARSTPELILKRLEARSIGSRSDIFKSILRKI